MINLQTYITEGIFDIDGNIDNIDYDVSSMGKMGIKSIVVKIFDGKDITDDKHIKSVFRGCSPKIFKEIDTKIFEKKVPKGIRFFFLAV